MKTLRAKILISTLALFQQLAWGAPPSGQVIGWGSNVSGEATGVPSPEYFGTGAVMVAGQVLNGVVAISAGSGHSLALRSDGTVFGWGDNHGGGAIGLVTPFPYRTNGQVRLSGRVLSDVTAISAAGGFSLATRSDGTVVAWGEGLAEKERAQVIVPVGLSNVLTAAGGWNYSMALRNDGTVVGWGVRGIPLGLSNIVAIAAGCGFYAPGLALMSNGTVLKWSTGGAEPVPVEATNVVGIAAGETHCLAMRRDGTVVGWGSNQFGAATGVPTKGFPSSASGVVFIKGQVLSNVAAIAAGHEFSLALKRDGTVVAWGYNGFHVTDVPAGLSAVVAIAAGQNFCLAITTNATPFIPKR